MMMPAKKEDGDRDRLIEFLKLTEGIEYRTVDVNVLNRPREKNFDYLLQANSGATLALEITWLTDKDETAADEREHHDFVQDKEKFLKLRQILESSISRAYLPCSISISVPFHVPCERKALNSLPADALAKAKVQLMTAIEGMSEPVLDGSYKLPNGQRALPFEMVEVRKEIGRDDSANLRGLLTNLISSAARSEHQAR